MTKCLFVAHQYVYFMLLIFVNLKQIKSLILCLPMVMADRLSYTFCFLLIKQIPIAIIDVLNMSLHFKLKNPQYKSL